MTGEQQKENEVNDKTQTGSSGQSHCSAADGQQLPVIAARSADEPDVCGTCSAEMLILHPLMAKVYWCPQCGTIRTPYRSFVPIDRKLDAATDHDGQ